MAVFNEARDSFYQNAGLPCTGSGQHQHGAVNVLNRFSLLCVWSEGFGHRQGSAPALCEKSAKTAMRKLA
jgi:hypothetical protein